MNLPKGKCVYVIQNKRSIKVGYTANIMQRLKAHNNLMKNPNAEVILIVYSEYAYRIEQGVHNLFKPIYKKETHKLSNKEAILKFITREQEDRKEQLKIFF